MPPIPSALALTPQKYISDKIMDAFHAADAAGNCTLPINTCQIPFAPNNVGLFDRPSPIGVIIYGGATVDPRSYSPLAFTLAQEYGMTVVIPVFENDLQFSSGTCNSGRLALAQADFPNIDKWIFVGHSFGGIGAMVDVWAESKEGTNFDDIAGLVLLASYSTGDLGCGPIDYSTTALPAAAVTASLDGIMNFTRWEENRFRFPENSTLFLSIEGGNHAQFGSYNDSESGQKDGEAKISPREQWKLTTAAIYDVALRSGLELPKHVDPTNSLTQEL
jgi:hypothetical protein